LSNAKVVVVHAVPGTDVRPEKYFDQPFENFLKEYADKELHRLQQEAGTAFPVYLQAGNISKVVREAALESDANLVLIGRGVARHFAGRLRTHAWSIIRDSPCPVLSL
jgi:nucleotide-binding universal stress UspA family protein